MRRENIASSSSDDECMEDVPLVAEQSMNSGATGATPSDRECGSPTNGEAHCRICLETSPFEELEEPCACKGSLQVRIC